MSEMNQTKEYLIELVNDLEYRNDFLSHSLNQMNKNRNVELLLSNLLTCGITALICYFI